MTLWQHFFHRLTSKLWLRPAIMGLGAVGWVGVGLVGEWLIPFRWQWTISKDTLVHLFSILASSMLGVATFSVSAMAAAFASVGSSASPRATRIIMRDEGVRSTLGAFLGAFIYAVVAITALSIMDFGPAGRFHLFAGFVVTVGWVLISFLRWVDRVSRLGRLGDTLETLKKAGRRAFLDPALAGTLGGRPLEQAPGSADGLQVRAECFGYLQVIDMAALQALAETAHVSIVLHVRPGAYLSRQKVVATVPGLGADQQVEFARSLLACFAVEPERDPELDPRFALILLSEVASRALSPAVNDPGTAIGVVDLQLELLDCWVQGRRQTVETRYDRLFVPRLTAEELLQDSLAPTARDGAGLLEVTLRLQKALTALQQLGLPELTEAVDAWRPEAVAMAEAALPTEAQRRRLRECVANASCR